MKKILNIFFILLFFTINLFAKNKQQQTYDPKGDSIELRLIPGTTQMYTAEQTDETFIDNKTTIAIKLVSSDNPTGTTKTNKIVDNPTFTIETPVNPNWKETNPLHRGFIQNKPKTIEESGITNAVDINTFISFKTNTEGKINIITNNIRIINENIINATNTLYLTVSNEISNVSEDLHNNYYDIDTITNNYYDITDITNLLSTNVWQDDLGHGQYSITINDLPFLTIDVNAKENVTTNLDIPTSLNELLDVDLDNGIDDGQLLTYSSDDSLWVAKNLPQSDWEANEDEVIFIKNKPKINTTNETSQNILTNEIIIGTIELHKISSTGDYDDLLRRPYLVTTNLESLEANEHELLSGDIQFHKISKTGAWSDLVGVPNDLARTGDIHNGIISFSTNNILIPNQSFGVNDSDNKTIDIPMPVVNDGSLTIGVSSGAAQTVSETFTANQAGNTTVDIKVPSELKNLSDVYNELDPSNGDTLVFDGEKWVAGEVSNVEVTDNTDYPEGLTVANVKVNGETNYIKIPHTNSAFINDADYATITQVHEIHKFVNSDEIIVLNQDDSTTIDFSNFNQQMFVLNDDTTGQTNTLILPPSDEMKLSKVILYLQEMPENEFWYDIDTSNFENKIPSKPWMRYENNALWKIELVSFPGEETWEFKNVKRIKDLQSKRTKLYYSNEEVIKTNIVGEITSETISDKNNLIKVDIGNNVTNIGNYAFYNCSGLTSVTIGDSVTSIGNHAFDSCINMTDLTIGNGITTVGEYVFANCSSLTDVVIPDSIKNIRYQMFANCSSLTNVTISEGVTSVYLQAFWYCANITSVVIPSSMYYIGESAFSGCSGLKDLTIPDTVTSLEDTAFRGCRGLTNIVIGTGISKIKNGVFRECSSLTSMTIPDNITGIGSMSFLGCTNLKNIVIPSTVTSIGDKAFYQCYSMNNVIIDKTASTVQGMSNYPWGLRRGCVITCSGGEIITIP